MAWTPGDPWPDTTYHGGAIHPAWSGYVRLIVQAQIAPGVAFTMGQSTTDALNAGNVMSQAGGLPLGAEPQAQPSGLWVDLTCDLTDVEITLGATSNAGVLSKPEAGTLTAKLYDPTGKYDPLNPTGPYSLSGVTRLLPGAPIRAFAEVVNAVTSTVSRYALFTGTADRWEESWTRYESDRVCNLIASDTTKLFVKMDRDEQTPQGAGETTKARLQRIIAFFGWDGVLVSPATSAATLQATTLAQSAWELVNRALDDELGFGFFEPQQPAATLAPGFRWYDRTIWSTNPAPRLEIGCEDDDPSYADIATEVQPASFDALLRNAAYVSRSGGTMQTVKNAASITKYGEQSINRTDLGLNDDAGVTLWGQTLVSMGSYPRTVLDHVTLEPAVFPRREIPPAGQLGPDWVWIMVLGLRLLADAVRVVWHGPTYDVDVTARIVGVKHAITTDHWETTWQTLPVRAVPSSASFHLGPHTNDRLDAGFVLGG